MKNVDVFVYSFWVQVEALFLIISRYIIFIVTMTFLHKFCFGTGLNHSTLQDFVRKEALYMLHHALEGSGGCAAFPAYNESFRLITRLAIGDKSSVVRIAAARCLKAFANIGGPGLGVNDFDLIASYCVKVRNISPRAILTRFSC